MKNWTREDGDPTFNFGGGWSVSVIIRFSHFNLFLDNPNGKPFMETICSETPVTMEEVEPIALAMAQKHIAETLERDTKALKNVEAMINKFDESIEQYSTPIRLNQSTEIQFVSLKKLDGSEPTHYAKILEDGEFVEMTNPLDIAWQCDDLRSANNALATSLANELRGRFGKSDNELPLTLLIRTWSENLP